MKRTPLDFDSRYKGAGSVANPARTARRKANQREFIGVDGEGVTYPAPWRDWFQELPNGELVKWPGKRHEYVLLSVGSESLHNDGERITTLDIFQFLWDQFQNNPSAIFVGFYLTYDFTEWFKDLPSNIASKLLSVEGVAARQRKIGRNVAPFPVEWQGWLFDVLDMRRFKLKPVGHSGPYLWVNDVGGFFQTSFLSAIDPKNWPTPILSDSEYETIRRGKGDRAAAVFGPEMIKYNTLENDVLGRMLTVLSSGFTKMGVKLNASQWYGPGQAASKWLNNIKAPDIDVVRYNMPEDVQQAARASYYGGWFEIMAHGHIPGSVYEYDINSAYPHAISNLPCLEHGSWKYENGLPDNPNLVLVHATVYGSKRNIGTMPHRTKQGAICRPRITTGTYWYHELIAAKLAGCIDTFTISYSWSFTQMCYHRPFQAIADLYESRLEVGKDTPLGKAYKLVYNSTYGKLAQSVGSPRYANPVYASLITSQCRTLVWDAISSHPDKSDSVVMVATDAVYFRSRHPYLSLSDKLGDWDETVRENMCQFMPGLYWDDSARNGGRVKSRGVAAGDLRDVIKAGDDAWHEFADSLPILREDFESTSEWLGEPAAARLAWPRLQVPIKFGLVSARLAVHRGNWSECGAIVNRPKILSGSPDDKRDAFSAHIRDGMIVTNPYDVASDGLVSHPYEKRFGLELQDHIIDEEIVTQDGHVDDELYEWVKNV